jgi:hypothetical protein
MSVAELTQLIRDLRDYEPALVDMIRVQTPLDNKAWQEVYGFTTYEEFLRQAMFSLWMLGAPRSQLWDEWGRPRTRPRGPLGWYRGVGPLVIQPGTRCQPEAFLKEAGKGNGEAVQGVMTAAAHRGCERTLTL